MEGRRAVRKAHLPTRGGASMMKLPCKTMLLAAGMAAFVSGETCASPITLPSATQSASASTFLAPFTSNSGTASATVDRPISPGDNTGGSAFGESSMAGQSASAQSNGATEAAAGMDYTVEVVGPYPGAVPVDVTGSLQASIIQSIGVFESTAEDTSFMKAEAGVTITPLGEPGLSAFVGTVGPGGTAFAFPCLLSGFPSPSCVINESGPTLTITSSGATLPFSSSVTLGFSEEMLLPANTETQVSVSANVESLDTDQVAEALADPFFQIDPTFLADNPGFSLVFSPGVENNAPGTAVPEPSSLALLLGGLAGAAALASARRLKPRVVSPT